MKFKQYLDEKSFRQMDIPSSFGVVFDLENIIDQLKTGKIKGLKGISSSSDIQFDFLGVARDAMLQMDSTKLLELNNITRIMYDNPHYLVSKNLGALRRLYSARSTGWVDQVFGNLFERLKVEVKTSKHRQLYYDMDYYGFRNVDYRGSKKIESSLKIENIKHLAIVVKKYINTIGTEKTGIEYDITVQDLEKALFNSLKFIGKVYASENEGVIKNDYLKVPSNSTLYILTSEPDNINQKIYDVIKQNMDIDNIDMMGVFRENDIDIKNLTDVSQYKRMVKYDNLINKLKGKFKVVKYDYIEFKAKQSEHGKNN